MAKEIKMNHEEKDLRQLLLDVSDYIGTLTRHCRPQLRFTGGWVRDKILGLDSKDIDIGIDSMTGLQFAIKLKEYLEQPEAKARYPENTLGKLAKIEANPEKSKHLETCTTKILGLEIDLVNLRKETYTEDSRNPQMEFGTPEEDALRRDATVNALFYNLDTCEVEDFTGRGLKDIERKVIKTPIDPYQTFRDDPLRVLRAIRFSSRLGWRIDDGDQRAMSDDKILDALNKKITRERVGIELTKMLKDSHPHQALRLIDHLGLYHAVFTMFNDELAQSVKTENWQKPCDQLHDFVSAELDYPKELKTEHTHDLRKSLKSIRPILLRSPNDAPSDIYHAWLLCAFVPWARVVPPSSQNKKGKAPLRPAALVARDGIKVDNNTVKLVDNAVRDLDDIIEVKDATVSKTSPTTSHLKRKQKSPTRSEQGMAIRHWGPQWRSSVMFASLTQIMITPEENHKELLAGYATWLSDLKDLDLLEACKLQPIVKGDVLAKALGVQVGPWVSKALDIVIAWQLENPDNRDPEAAISEIKSKKKDLGFG